MHARTCNCIHTCISGIVQVGDARMYACTHTHARLMYAQWETEWLGWSKTPASCGNQCQSESSHLTVPSATGQQSWSTGNGQVVSNRDVCARHAHTATVTRRPAGTGAL